MMIFHTGCLIYKITLITTGSDDSFISDTDASQITVRIIRILNTDFPCRTIWLGTQHMRIAPQIDHGTLNTIMFHDFHNSSGCVAFGNSTQVNFHPFRKGNG